MKKKTTEEFISELKQIHGNNYDYSKVVYEGANKHITLICPKHGEFAMQPAELLHGRSCPKCAADKKRKSQDDFIRQANTVHNGFFDYSKVNYKNSHSKVVITCPLHGDFEQSPIKHINGQGCPTCAKKHIRHNVTQCTEKHTNKTKTTEQFIEECKTVWGNKYDYCKVNYINASTKVCIVCPEHGEFWIKPRSFVNKAHPRGCSKCSGRELTAEDFIALASKIHNGKYDYSATVYNGMHEYVEFICPEHGKIRQKAYLHLDSCGCPQCAKKINVNETKLFNFLSEAMPEYDFVHGYRDKDMLGRQEFDIYSEKHKIAIEYQGKQHYLPIAYFGGDFAYKRQMEWDAIKAKAAEKNGVRLFYFTYDKTLNAPNLIHDEEELISIIKGKGAKAD